MRKIICLVTAILLLLAGCTQKEDKTVTPAETEQANQLYEILEEDGAWYLVMNGEYAQNPEDYGSWELFKGCVEFKAVGEMKHDIETGNFTEEELEKMAGYITDDKGRIPLCDLSALIEPTYPCEFVYQSVRWSGKNYDFDLAENESVAQKGMYANFEIVNEGDWEASVQFYSNFEEEYNGDFDKIEAEPERDATVYYTHVYNAEDRIENKKGVYYTIAADSKLLHIWEEYRVDTSPNVPWRVTVFGKQQGELFRVIITELEERPSVEWLSQFGAALYTES
ncbi:MAG: hypothetical protein IJV82_01570 [Oscillospiraceae bacterium]|nr:hypothetical protein [Oscillospiraceae bacterium]